jgi:hypothetical protein
VPMVRPRLASVVIVVFFMFKEPPEP